MLDIIAGIFSDPVADAVSQLGIAGVCLFLMFKLLTAKANERADKAIEIASSNAQVQKQMVKTLEAIEQRLISIESSERTSETTLALMEKVVETQAESMKSLLTISARQTTLMEKLEDNQIEMRKDIQAVLQLLAAHPDVIALINKTDG